MAGQTSPVEILTLTEYWERVSKGEAIDPHTLILLPVTTLQQTLEGLDELEASMARQEQLIDEAFALFKRGTP